MWRAGASYDLTGNGRTALKASYSRYGLQVGIDRVTNVNPLSATASRPARGPTRTATASSSCRKSTSRTCSAFSGGVSTFYDPTGVSWPYSDEVTAGVETQVTGAVRIGAMYYYRTNRDQFGQRNLAVPTSSLHAVHRDRPERPWRNGATPKPTTVTVYNLAPGVDERAEQHPRQRRLPRHRVQGHRVHGARRASRRSGRWWPASRSARTPADRRRRAASPTAATSTIRTSRSIRRASSATTPRWRCGVGQLRAAAAPSTSPAR